MIPSQPNRFSERFFTSTLPVSILKIYWASTNRLTLLFIMCHFFVKRIVFFELIKAISFSILFTFRISAMRFFIFMSFFSLELCTYNLNINRMWLLRHLLFSKMESLFAESRYWKITVCAVKVGKATLFWLNQTELD